MNKNPSSINIQFIKVIASSLMISQFFYLFVLHQTLKPLENQLPLNTEWLPDWTNPIDIASVVITIGLVVMVVKIPETLYRFSKSDEIEIDRLSPQANATPFPNGLFIPWLIRFALIEAIGLQGLAIAFTKRTPNFILPFFALSFLLMIRYFPSSTIKVHDDLR